MNKKVGMFVFLIVSIVIMSGFAGSSSVYITPKPAATTDNLVCHVTGGCAGYHIVRWYRNGNFHSETITNGAFAVDSSQTSEGDTWQCKAYDYCSQNFMGQDNVVVQITNTPPLITPNIPDVTLLQDSGMNLAVLDLYAYVTDAQTPDNGLSYQIISETDTSVVDCSISANEFVDCNVQPSMVGYSDVRVRITDPQGLFAEDVFRVNITPVNQPPILNIVSPTPGQQFAPCENMTFLVNATDADGSIQSITWTINGTDYLGNNFTLAASGFSAGIIPITLTVADNLGAQTTLNFNMSVVAHTNPTVTIMLPVNNPVPTMIYPFATGAQVDFSALAAATDICTPTLGFNYFWSDTVDPIFATTQNFTLNNLTQGIHNMTVYATDNLNGEAYASIILNMTPAPNLPPIANIITPAMSQQFVSVCQAVDFTAQISDPDGVITNIDWIFNGTQVNSQDNFTMNVTGLPDDNYTVTLIVEDNSSAPNSQTTTSVMFETIPHTAPAVSITSPLNSSVWPEGSFVAFNANAASTDACTGPFNWIWTDNNNPWFSVYQTFTLNNLTAGQHNITAYAYDNYGQSNYSRISINVTDVPNLAPVITGIRCINETGGPRLKEWDPIYCNASATDLDGAITQWLWSVNGSGVNIGPNSSDDTFNLLAGLDDGNYTVSLMVLDNGTGFDQQSAAGFINIEVFANIPPVVAITNPLTDPYWNMEFCPVNFSAAASDPDGYIMLPGNEIYTWSIAMSNGTSLPSYTTQQSFTYADMLPVGFNTFSVTVSDDDSATASDSLSINTTANVGPTIQISLPSSVGSFNISEGNNITFDASVIAGNFDDCSDCALGDYGWTWFDTYDDGVNPPSTMQISSQQSFTLINPGVGNHTITATGTDCYLDSGIDTIVVNVMEIPNQIPVVTIWEPNSTTAGYYIDDCENVGFNASAVDPDGDDISAWLWNYNTVDGPQSNNLPVFTVPAANFTPGMNHTTTAYVFDNQSPAGMGSAQRIFQVISHTDPIANINIPTNGSMWPLGQVLNFTGSGTATDRCNADQFSWIWTDDVSGQISTAQSFGTDLLARGWHTITLYVTDQFQHTDSTSIRINITELVNIPPVINSINCYDMTGSTTIMEFDNFFCNATATDVDGNITTWIWNIDSFPTQTGSSTYLSPAGLANGTYNATLTVVDNGTTTPPLSTTMTVPLVITNNAPVATVTPPTQTGVEPYDAVFDCNITGGNMPLIYSFDYGNGITDILPAGNTTSAQFNITYAQNGTFTVSCNVTDMDGDTSFATATATITDTAPFANFTFSPLTPFENETVTFTDFSTAYDMPISWFWDFGDGTNSTLQNPAHRYLQQSLTGTYTITLTVTDADGTTNSMAQLITVLDTVPQGFITAPNQTIEGTNETFAGFGLGYDQPLSYQWTFSDTGLVVPGQVVGYVFVQDGNYTATLRVTDNDGSFVDVVHNIEVLDTAPTAVAGPDQIIDECTLVNFNGSLSTAYDMPITYSWDFGDSIGTGTGAAPSYTYTADGAYTVNLTVTDNDLSTASDTLQVTVLDTAPNAFFTYTPLNPDEGALISFDSAGSILNTCDGPQNYTWDFGDGNTSTGAATTHTYADQGTYTVNLTITDMDGSTDSYPLTITVNDVSPNITSLAYAPIPNYEGNTTQFSITAVDTPPYDTITNYAWDFGDGNTASGLGITNPANTYADNGTYNVTVTVTDEDSSTVQSLLVAVGNVPPAVEAYGPYYCTNGTNVGLIATATDPAGANDPITYEWDFDYDNITFDVNSTLQFPTITCPVANGTYTIAVRASDDDGGSSIDTALLNVTLIAVNNPPAFTPSLISQFAPVGVLFTYDINATDPDGDSYNFTVENATLYSIGLTSGVFLFTPPAAPNNYTVNVTVCDDSGFANACTSGQFTIFAAAANNPPTASFTITPNPQSEGVDVTFDASGSTDSDGTIIGYLWNFGDGNTGSGMTVTHPYNDNEVYTVNLTVIDDGGLSSSLAQTATINNAAPVPAIIGGGVNVTEGSLVPLSGSATDVVNDTLTYEWDLDNDGLYDNAAGQNANFNATDDIGSPFTVGLRVTDDDGGIGIITTTITITNVAPTAVCGGPYAGTEGTPVVFSGSQTDPGVSDTFGYQWDFTYNGSFAVDSTLQNPANNYNDDFSGTAGLIVTDNSGAASPLCTAAVTITNVNPVISSVTNSGPVNEGSTALITVFATDAGADTLTYDFDCDGDLVYEVTGQSANNYNCAFADDTGSPFTVNVRVNDDDGGSATSSTLVTVNNVAPVANADGPYTCTQGTPITLLGSATDAGTDTFSYAWDFTNDGIFDAFIQNATYPCTDTIGVHTLLLQVTDDDLGQNNATSTVNITAAAINNPPVFNPALADQIATIGVPFVYDINATDADAGDILTYTDDSALFTINSATGMISFTPAAASATTINITVCDDSGFANACTSGTFLLNITAAAANNPPVINTITLTPNPVLVDGILTCSVTTSDADGDPVTVSYGWTTTGGYNASLAGEAASTLDLSTIAGEANGDIITCTATPNDGTVNGVSAAANSTVNSVIVNVPPVANAGPDQSVLNNTLVTLNGTGSNDPDTSPNATLEYSWTQISGPAAALSSTTAISPTFTPTLNGTYIFNLTVFDGQDYASDTVTVDVFLPSDAITTSGIVFYNDSFNQITQIGTGQNFYAFLTISNMKTLPLTGVPSITDADSLGFTIIGASDTPPGPLDNTILSNIGAVPNPATVTIYWYMTATAGTNTISINTAGIVDTATLTVI